MQSDQVAPLVFLVLIVALFWLFIIRPARNRQREATALQGSLMVGQKVMLTSGIHGEIAGLGDETLELTVAPGTTITVHRQAVMRTLTEPADSSPDAMDSAEPSDRDDKQA